MAEEIDAIIKASALSPNRRDLLAESLKGIAGAIPVVGPAIAEAVGALVPEQRIDRLTNFTADLKRQLDLAGTSNEAFGSRLRNDPEFLATFEEAVDQAIRSGSARRREHLASVLTNGVERSGVSIANKILSLLRSVGDEEVVWLKFLSLPGQQRRDFQAQNWGLLGPASRLMGAEEAARAAIQDGYRATLQMHGLIEQTLGSGGPPSAKVTRLGRLLLSEIEMGTGSLSDAHEDTETNEE